MKPDFFHIKNWRQFQHYRDRNPPWIKLHVEILASADWVMLTDASRLLAIVCMVIAAKNDGKVPNNPDYIKRVAYLDQRPNLTPLIESGFLINSQADASDVVQEQATARPEAEAYRTDTESEKKDSSASGDAADLKAAGLHWVAFWMAYPLKKGKKPAAAAYARAIRGGATPEAIMAGLLAYKAGKPDEQHWAHAQKWLNQERWNDEYRIVSRETDAAMQPPADAQLAARRAGYAKSGFWLKDQWGPVPADITPPDELEIPAFLDRRPLRAETDILARVLGDGPAALATRGIK